MQSPLQIGVRAPSLAFGTVFWLIKSLWSRFAPTKSISKDGGADFTAAVHAACHFPCHQTPGYVLCTHSHKYPRRFVWTLPITACPRRVYDTCTYCDCPSLSSLKSFSATQVARDQEHMGDMLPLRVLARSASAIRNFWRVSQYSCKAVRERAG